jgi:hypothetical protein
MAYSVNQAADAIVQSALTIAADGVNDISTVLTDVQDSVLSAGGVRAEYGDNSTTSLNINTAAGAMVVDDLMQKISTKVQVAAQLLSAANNINKTASRVLSQG